MMHQMMHIDDASYDAHPQYPRSINCASANTEAKKRLHNKLCGGSWQKSPEIKESCCCCPPWKAI